MNMSDSCDDHKWMGNGECPDCKWTWAHLGPSVPEAPKLASADPDFDALLNMVVDIHLRGGNQDSVILLDSYPRRVETRLLSTLRVTHMKTKYRIHVQSNMCHPETCNHDKHYPYVIMATPADADGFHDSVNEYPLSHHETSQEAETLLRRLNTGDILGTTEDRVANWLSIIGEGAPEVTQYQLVRERTARFAEEAFEAIRSTGTVTSDELIGLLNYVWNSNTPDTTQDELADALFTLTALATACKINLDRAFDAKIAAAFVPEKMRKVRAKFLAMRSSGHVCPPFRDSLPSVCLHCDNTRHVWDERGEGPWHCPACVVPEESWLRKNNAVGWKDWGLGKVTILDLNWALRAAAIQLGVNGSIVVVPMDALSPA